MASRKRDLSGVYQQRKGVSSSATRKQQQQQQQQQQEKGDGARNQPSTPLRPLAARANAGAGSRSSSVAQPSILPSLNVRRKQDDLDGIEEILRQFDMNMLYGPCMGVSRMERWNRAYNMGLNPPQDVKNLLEHAGGVDECLWEGSV